MLRFGLLSLAASLCAGCVVAPNYTYSGPGLTYGASAREGGDVAAGRSDQPRFGNHLENDYGSDDSAFAAADYYDEDAPDYIAYPAYYGALWPVYYTYYDPFFEPYFYYGVTFFPRAYFTYAYGDYGFFPYSPFVLSFWDGYYNWNWWYLRYPWYAGYYPAHRFGSARNERVTLAYLQGSGHRGYPFGNRAHASAGLKAGFPRSEHASMRTRAVRGVAVARPAASLRSADYAARRSSEISSRASPTPESYWVTAMPGSRASGLRSGDEQRGSDGAVPDRARASNGRSFGLAEDARNANQRGAPIGRTGAQATGFDGFDRNLGPPRDAAALPHQSVAPERVAAPTPDYQIHTEPSDRANTPTSSHIEAHESRDGDHVRRDR